MKNLAILAAALGLLIAAPAMSEDCFINSSVMLVADGADEGVPSVFVVALNNGTVWDVHPDNVWIARTGAGGGVREGHYIQICRSWGSLHMKVRNTGDSFVVFQR